MIDLNAETLAPEIEAETARIEALLDSGAACRDYRLNRAVTYLVNAGASETVAARLVPTLNNRSLAIVCAYAKAEKGAL